MVPFWLGDSSPQNQQWEELMLPFVSYFSFLTFFSFIFSWLSFLQRLNDFFLVPLMSISRAVFVLNAPLFLLLSPFMTTLSLDVCPEDSSVVF